jgi:hypothetical protein
MNAAYDRLGKSRFAGIKLEELDETAYVAYRNAITTNQKKVVRSRRWKGLKTLFS